MERIKNLVDRLQEQVKQNADLSQMQHTLQLIQAELNHLQKTSGRTLGTSKVAVVMPTRVSVASEPIFKEGEKTIEKEPVATTVVQPKQKKESQLDFAFDPMNEIPTFSQYKMGKEINESIEQQQSLNDRLKENRTELMHTLKDTPVRDLRKAIGINDRFVFINELFRGDEAMYERSIKTINNFNIYPEAEYWMNRELKIKLGWDDTREIVSHFYHLVKRRFS